MAKKVSPELAVVIGVTVFAALSYGAFRFWMQGNLLFENTDVDLTDRPTEREGINPGSTYLLPSDLYLEKWDGYSLDKPFPGREAIPPSGPLNSVRPKSRMEYQANPSRWPHIVGFLEPGATIRVDKIFRFNTVTMSELRVVGRVIDGQRAYDGVCWRNPDLTHSLESRGDNPR